MIILSLNTPQVSLLPEIHPSSVLSTYLPCLWLIYLLLKSFLCLFQSSPKLPCVPLYSFIVLSSESQDLLFCYCSLLSQLYVSPLRTMPPPWSLPFLFLTSSKQFFPLILPSHLKFLSLPQTTPDNSHSVFRWRVIIITVLYSQVKLTAIPSCPIHQTYSSLTQDKVLHITVHVHRLVFFRTNQQSETLRLLIHWKVNIFCTDTNYTFNSPHYANLTLTVLFN